MGLREAFTHLTMPGSTAQSKGYVWIPGANMGPFDIVDGGDEIGEWGGANCATTEVMTYIMPLPEDMDPTGAITLRDYLVFDAVSDSDVFEIDHLYTLVETTAVTDPVHVVPATAFTSEDAALTIVEATHESRLYMPGLATLAGSTVTQTQIDDRDFLVLGWEVTLTTMTENEFILIGSELAYTRKHV